MARTNAYRIPLDWREEYGRSASIGIKGEHRPSSPSDSDKELVPTSLGVGNLAKKLGGEA